MSASSSSISLASGSTSGGGGSSVSGDLDESVSSPATESEYSAPSREKRVGRNGSASSSSRSLRYNSNQGSSRNSRASSPSPFTYANIYEPNQSTFYDHPAAGYNPSQYMYPYPSPGMPPNPYYGAYPYYQYPYPTPPPPPPPQHNTSDPSTPSSGDPYSSGMYPHQYAWTPPPPHPMQSPPPTQMPPPGAPPPPMHSPPQYPYMPSSHHPYAYPMPGYYPIAAGPPVDPSTTHINSHQAIYDAPRSLNNGSAMAPHNSGRNVNETASPPSGGNNSQRHGSVSGAKGRNASAMNQGRGAWSFGPGVGQGGRITSPSEPVGPRLNYTRRPSNNSLASSATSRSSNCDDVASTAVSFFYSCAFICSLLIGFPSCSHHQRLPHHHGGRRRPPSIRSLLAQIGPSASRPSLRCTRPRHAIAITHTVIPAPCRPSLAHRETLTGTGIITIITVTTKMILAARLHSSNRLRCSRLPSSRLCRQGKAWCPRNAFL